MRKNKSVNLFAYSFFIPSLVLGIILLFLLYFVILAGFPFIIFNIPVVFHIVVTYLTYVCALKKDLIDPSYNFSKTKWVLTIFIVHAFFLNLLCLFTDIGIYDNNSEIILGILIYIYLTSVSLSVIACAACFSIIRWRKIKKVKILRTDLLYLFFAPLFLFFNVWISIMIMLIRAG